MPEKDRFEKSLGAGWCASYQYVKNDSASPGEVNDKLVKSLTRVLREQGGVPGLHAMMDVIVTPPGSSLLENFEAIDDIAGSEFRHRHTKVMARVAKSLLARKLASGGTLEPQDRVHRFAEKTCFALVEHYFFGRVCPKLVAEGRFANYDEACRWQNQVEREIEPAIVKVAGKLLQNADAKGLRAPRRTSIRLPTEDLVKEPLI